jgi:hypothetical protein
MQPVVVFLSLVCSALGATFYQKDSHQGSGFLKSFTVESIPDPTHGRVNYVSAATAASQNLTFSSGDHFVMRADFKTTLSSSGPGRNSVRLKSIQRYTNVVMIFNVRHMPVGCGTWPAIWTLGDDWPNQGEIDIMEGINNQGANSMTLHTSSGCTVPFSRSQSGVTLGTNCDVGATNNAGCGVQSTDSRSFGPSFNANGGGWYAMERSPSEVKVWFWSRAASNVPSDVKNGATTINTNGWGQPNAYFPDTSCDIDDHFGPQNIMIDLTFCGDWAGSHYGESGCPSSCESNHLFSFLCYPILMSTVMSFP